MVGGRQPLRGRRPAILCGQHATPQAIAPLSRARQAAATWVLRARRLTGCLGDVPLAQGVVPAHQLEQLAKGQLALGFEGDPGGGVAPCPGAGRAGQHLPLGHVHCAHLQLGCSKAWARGSAPMTAMIRTHESTPARKHNRNCLGCVPRERQRGTRAAPAQAPSSAHAWAAAALPAWRNLPFQGAQRAPAASSRTAGPRQRVLHSAGVPLLHARGGTRAPVSRRHIPRRCYQAASTTYSPCSDCFWVEGPAARWHALVRAIGGRARWRVVSKAEGWSAGLRR